MDSGHASWDEPHFTAMVTVTVVFSHRYKLRLKKKSSTDRPQQLSITINYTTQHYQRAAL
jgi:hypothetical protein